MNQEDYAIVIGIQHYPRFGDDPPPTPHDLNGPDNDSAAIYDWLTDPNGGGVPEANAQLICSAQFDPATWRSAGFAEPAEREIGNAFVCLRQTPTRDDGRIGRRLYVYASGHGFGVDRCTGALYTADASPNMLNHFYISEWFKWFVNAGLFDEHVLWFDACITRNRLKTPKPVTFPIRIATDTSGERTFAAYAARFPTQAVERLMPDGKVHGAFTYTLLLGLKGAADPENTGTITTNQLKAYLINNMRSYMSEEDLADPDVSNEPDFGPDDEFVLVKYDRPRQQARAVISTEEARRILKLTVTASDPMTELVVIDHSFALAARGIDKIEADLPAGLYKVRAKSGRGEWEVSVELDRHRTVSVPNIEFASASPLSLTSRSHETHQVAAKDKSRQPQRTFGNGATIFVMVRWWTAAGEAYPPPLDPEAPVRSLSLHKASGQHLTNLWQAAKQGDLNQDPWSACTVTVDPGLYFLRMKHPDGAELEQTITALDGWQTQVFLLFEPHRELSESADPSANDLPTDMSMLICRIGFNPADANMRSADAARLALADERSVMSQDIGDMISGETENPMLALFAAHLLLLLKRKEESDAERAGEAASSPPVRPAKFDKALFKKIFANLERLFGSDHPDIRALALEAKSKPRRGAISAPPMLWNSWQMLISGSYKYRSLVPFKLWKSAGSPTAHRPFLTRLHEAVTEGERVKNVSEVANAMLDNLLSPQQKERLAPSAIPLDQLVSAGRRKTENAAKVRPEQHPTVDESKQLVSKALGLPRSVIDRVSRAGK